MTSYILSLIFIYSSLYNIDPYLVMNVIRTESNYNKYAIGTHGEIGLMQLMPNSFPKYNKSQLFNIETNIKLGIKHLSEAKHNCKHQELNQFIICYNKGIKGGNKVQYPHKDKYYQRVTNENF